MVTGLLTTDTPIAASRLPELVGKVAETSTVVAGDLLLDSFAIAGTVALGEIETAYQAIKGIVTPIVQSISDFVKHLETQIDAATKAAEKLASQFEAALAAIFADIDQCLDQLKTLTDTFVDAVRDWGAQQIEANVWPPLQPVAIGLWDAALEIATWIPQLFVDIVDIAGHALHDMLASAAERAATAGDQVHAAVRQLVHSSVHTDYLVPLDLAGNSRTIGTDRHDFARIGCDLIINDPRYIAMVAANLNRAADAARLNSNLKAANANVAAINTYADAAINESFRLVSGEYTPNVSVSPPEGSVCEGALVLEIVVNGANATYLGGGVLQDAAASAGPDRRDASRRGCVGVGLPRQVGQRPGHVAARDAVPRRRHKHTRRTICTGERMVTVDEVRVPEALALREPPPLGPFEAPAAALRLDAAGTARSLAAQAVRRNGVPPGIPPTRPTIRAVGGATSDAQPADRFAGLGALPRIELAPGCHRVIASLSSGPDINDPTGLGSNARAAAKTTFSLSPPDDHLIAEIYDRAYELYEHRRATGAPGDATGDWLAAQAAVLPRFVRDRAYFLWQKHGSPVGTEAVADWLDAELATWLSRIARRKRISGHHGRRPVPGRPDRRKGQPPQTTRPDRDESGAWVARRRCREGDGGRCCRWAQIQRHPPPVPGGISIEHTRRLLGYAELARPLVAVESVVVSTCVSSECRDRSRCDPRPAPAGRPGCLACQRGKPPLPPATDDTPVADLARDRPH